MSTISLRPVTHDNLNQVVALSGTLKGGQDRFVAVNAFSLAEAYVNEPAWPRAIYDDDTPVGFLMLHDDPRKAEYFLWRFMIGGQFQGRGYGRAAIQLLVEYVRQRPGATRLLTSCVQGEGSPEGFYRRLGFIPDGQMHDEELGLVLELPPAVAPPTPACAAEYPDYAQVNRDNWNRQAADWAESGRKDWDLPEPAWGIWRIPNAELPLLPEDMKGVAAIELGCGSGYVSAWMHRRGAQVTGIDPTINQLSTARQLAAEHNFDIEWIESIAESVPKPDGAYDFAISEYGAAIWADPYVWIPEAHRLLRAGGELVFLGNSMWQQVCTPHVADGRAETQLHHSYFGWHRADWSGIEEDGGIEFNLPTGTWMRLFDQTGFDVLAFDELQAPEHWTEERFWVPADWAKRYPSEQVWRLRKR
jgi:SAM-dependent methyltransferase/GNAT superfamily N-acetyltransferase